MGVAAAYAIGGSAVLGAATSYMAGEKQAQAQEHAADVQWQIYQQQRKDLQPYYQAGYGALNQIQANMPEYNKPFTMQDFYANKDPGYQFRLDQGLNAVNRAAAASGGAVGSSALRELGNYAQGAASQEYGAAFNRYQQQIQNSYNRLASVAQIGQTGVGQGTQAGSQAGSGIASALSGIGSAQAAGMVGASNALTGGVSSGINYYQTQSLLDAIKSKQDYSHPTIYGYGEQELPAANESGYLPA